MATTNNWWRIRGIVIWGEQVCYLEDATPPIFGVTRCETKKEEENTLSQWHNQFIDHGYTYMGGSIDEGSLGYIHKSGKLVMIWITKMDK